MSNPYSSPSSGWEDSLEGGPAPPQVDRGLVGQVRVVSVLMMVQGGLDVAMGLGLTAMAAVTGVVLSNDPQFQENQANMPYMPLFISLLYGGMGIVAIVVGGLNLWAGIRNWNFRGRGLALGALTSGFAMILTCYCLPTSIALFIYGLVVYCNGPVVTAFRMGEKGFTADEILAAFYSGQPLPDASGK